MRWITLRILGTDLVELGVGRADDEPAEPAAIQSMPGPHSADLTTSPVSFGFGAATPHDEPTEWEDRAP